MAKTFANPMYQRLAIAFLVPHNEKLLSPTMHSRTSLAMIFKNSYKNNMKNMLMLFLANILSNTSIGQSPRDEQLVKNVVMAFQDDFNDGGFKKAGSYTTKDWEHINPAGGITKGRAEVLKEVRAVHQTFLKGVSLAIESMTIRFLTPTIAIANVVHKIGDYELPEGLKHQNERQMKTYIIVKRQNKWLLTHDQNTVIVAQ